MTSDVTLRYFQALGRAQPLRHALADAGTAFDDVRVELRSWPAHKEDPAFSGPFRTLPTLTWGGETFGETLPIASVLARRLEHHRGIDEARTAELEAMCSYCYLDILLRCGDMIYADLLYPGCSLGDALPRHAGWLLAKLDVLERRIPEGAWVGGGRPIMADFFAGEACETSRYLLGPAREPALRSRLPRLSSLAERLRDRPALAESWRRRPPSFTARPDEAEAVERIRALDFSSVGL